LQLTERYIRIGFHFSEDNILVRKKNLLML